MPNFDKTEFSFLIVRSIHGVLQGVLGPLLHPPPPRPLIKIHDGLFYRFSFLAFIACCALHCTYRIRNTIGMLLLRNTSDKWNALE